MKGGGGVIRIDLLIALIAILCSPVVSDLVISKLDRRIDLTSQIVRMTSTLKVENTGSDPVSDVLVAFPDHQAKNIVLFIGASSEGKGKTKSSSGSLSIKVVHPEGMPPSLTWYSLSLPKELGKGESLTLDLFAVFTHILQPFPEKITQAENQLVLFQDSAYFLSPYLVKVQSLSLKLPEAKVESYTKLENSKLSGSEIKYGPYENLPALQYSPVSIHFVSNHPFPVAQELVREIEISHWGNVQITEHYNLIHGGAHAATARGFRLSPSIGRFSTLKPKTDAKKKKKGKKMNQVLPEMMMKKKNQVEPEMKEKQGKKKQVEPEIIKAGDYVNISDLLFTKKRDYLVKFNGDKVKAEHLAGKVIIIYFGSLSYNYIREQWATKNLIDLYTAIQPKNLGFEVVWVPIIDNKTLQKDHPEEVFKEKFAYMPWPCIPYSDLPSGERLLTRFGQFKLPSPFIIDPTGKVLHCFAAGAGSILLKYGVEAFPFSYERMQSLISEDLALEKQISLKTLLATPERDYLISNKGKQVPIGNLEDKVVALYLYEDGLTEKLTKKLKRVYKQLAKRRVDFEVVLVYLHSTGSTFDCVSEDSFNKRFKNMPWLALPFKDPKCMKVARIFDYPYSLNGPEIPDPTLVIIGPHGKFVGIFGSDILMNFGIEAYPFTRERVLELETEKAKKLKLNSLLDPNVVLRGQDGSAIKVSKLMMEKRVLLIIETTNVIRSARFLAMLKEKYLQKKSKDDEFEVIHICLRTEQSAYNNEVCGEDFPWLLHHFHDTTLLARQILGHVFMYGLVRGTALVAFERGGMLVTKAWGREFGAREDMDFPFAEDLEKGIWREMNYVYNFDYYEDE